MPPYLIVCSGQKRVGKPEEFFWFVVPELWHVSGKETGDMNGRIGDTRGSCCV